jgi:hypothetical protein
MKHHNSNIRSANASWAFALVCAFAIATATGEARAQSKFVYAGEPVHPGCVHALAMRQGDAVPVTTAVSLQGCATSARSKSEISWQDDVTTFEDDTILGGGSFGYRELTQLDNGIFALAILRILPDGKARVSMAAVKMIARPMIRHGQIVNLEMLELLGEMWIPDMQLLSFRSMGNIVHFSAGVGPDRVERNVDFTRLGKLRKN